MTSAARVDWSAHRTRPPRSASSGRATGRAGSISSASARRRTRRLRAVHRASRARSAATASRSCSRRRPGRPTTSRTRTATAGATRGTSAARRTSIDLTRPFLDFGLPLHFNDWDLTFLTWLQQTGKQVDFLSDQDVDALASGDELAHNYDLVVFPGHEEYVTAARARRDHALPQPRRQPRVPRGEQPVLGGARRRRR